MAKTQIEKMTAFLDETIAYYSVDPNARRCATIGGNCYYNPQDVGKEGISEGCAIGRKMNKRQLKKAIGVGCRASILHEHEKGNLLPVALREFDKFFLNLVQSLHDNAKNWGKNGLSESGEKFVAAIRRDYLTT